MRRLLEKSLVLVLSLALCLTALSSLSLLVLADEDTPAGYNYQYSDTVTREYFCYRLVLLMAAAQNTTVDNLYRNLTETSQAGFLDSSAPYVSIARIYGITVGYNDESFAPDDPLTRANAAVMLCKLIQVIAPDYWDGDADYFADAQTATEILDTIEIPDYAANCVGYVVGTGIMELEHSGNFDPFGTMNIEEAESILLVFAEYLNTPLHPEKVTVTVNSNAGGVCSENGPVMIDYGSDFSVSLTADEGMCIDSVQIDDAAAPGFEAGSQNWTLKLSNVIADQTIAVAYQSCICQITVATEGKGNTSVDSSVTVNYAEDYTISFYPEFGWKVSTATINGKSASVSDNVLELDAITDDQEIEVVFSRGFLLRMIRSWILYAVLVVLAILVFILIRHLRKNSIADKKRTEDLGQQEDGLASALEQHKREQEEQMRKSEQPPKEISFQYHPRREPFASSGTVNMFTEGTCNMFDEQNTTGSNNQILVLTQRQEDGGQQFRVPLQGTIRVGRIQEDNQIAIPNKTVSSQHCVVRAVDSSAILMDVGSKNGTVMIRNGERTEITQQSHAVLQDGDELHLGTAVLTVSFEEA